MRRLRHALAGCVYLASTSLAFAASDETINVQALRPPVVEGAVRALLAPGYDRQLSRWNGDICVGIFGLQSQFSQIVQRHIAEAATYAGVRASFDCNAPNVFVLFTNDGTQTFEKLHQLSPKLLHGLDTSGADARNTDGPSSSSVANLEVPRAIRWFAATDITPAVGVYVQTMGASSPGSPFRGLPVISSDNISFLSTNTVEQTRYMAIIVDVSKIGGMNWGQVASCLGMITIAQPAMADRYPAFSVLANADLVSEAGAASPDLTAFDRKLIKAEYDADPDQSAADGRAQIVQTILRKP